MIPEFSGEVEKKLSFMAEKGTKVLITGGSGYFGSVLTEMLIDRGFEVTVVDNLSYSQSTLFNLFYSGKLTFIFGDVTSEKFMEKLLSEGKYDFIFPLAAVVGFPVSEQKPEITWMINNGAIGSLLKHRKKGQKIIFPTTNSGYGITDGKSECTEDSPLNPISTYGRSKVAAENAVSAAGDSICFRLATLFGFSQRMRTDLLVNDFVYKAVKEKSIILFERKFKRNFLHVRDASRAFLWAMVNWEAMKNRTYNLGHPDYNISKEGLCLLIKKRVPGLNIFHAEIGQDPDKRNYVVSNARVLSTGFTFKYTLEAGIDELARGYEAFRDYRFKNY
ncbi:MAG: NAD(P)-dependent oxidoreductase [Candidatus Micrarchaeota archaeon]|nr:NAD(P)-dependent oxidoreductase [Candidatus Micrarchaeota archaeon]